MKLYDIEQSIAALVDPETGEIADFETFEALQMEREEKLENMALWHKDLLAEATALKNEISNLSERKKAAENKAESLKRYLSMFLCGEKFKTTRCDISFRKSTAVEIADETFFVASASGDEPYIVQQSPKIDRTELKNLLKNGAEIEGAELVERSNIQIK